MPLLGPDGRALPPSPTKGLLLPDGTPAVQATEPGQAAACRLVAFVAAMPALEQVLTDIAQAREAADEKVELTAAQRLTVQAVQMAARWQREARELVRKAAGVTQEAGSEPA
jgi:hypothetical protein